MDVVLAGLYCHLGRGRRSGEAVSSGSPVHKFSMDSWKWIGGHHIMNPKKKGHAKVS